MVAMNENSECHCGSGRSLSDCCGPILAGGPAATAEALMRARYSAYVSHQIDFLLESLHPDYRTDFDQDATRRWADSAQWLGLEILATDAGGTEDDVGTVEFIASFQEKGATRQHRELAHFRRCESRWYYVEGSLPKPVQVVRDAPKVGRNDPCPCGSGKKFKKCCGH